MSILEHRSSLFSVYGALSGEYERNPNFWAKDVDFTCVGVWNSDTRNKEQTASGLMTYAEDGSNRISGTLITKKHLVFCRHEGYHLNPNDTIIFIGNNNEKHVATIDNVITSNIIPIINSDRMPADIVIGRLTQDVPSFIKPAKILPLNWYEYLPINCA